MLARIALTIALLLTGTPVEAQETCGPRADILRKLERAYGEVTVARGLTLDGLMMQMLAGPRGNWTVVITFPDGQSCLVMAGEAFEQVPARGGGES